MGACSRKEEQGRLGIGAIELAQLKILIARPYGPNRLNLTEQCEIAKPAPKRRNYGDILFKKQDSSSR